MSGAPNGGVPKIRSTTNAAHYVWGDVCDGWHLLDSESLSIIQERIPPGKGEVRHYHERAEQFFYVLAGTASMEGAGKTIPIHAGGGLHIQPGVPHKLINRASENLSLLVISSPKAHGDKVEVE